MTFHGWTDAVLGSYEGLEVDNSRSYWQAHKKDYDELARKPMEALLSELREGFGDGRIFRPQLARYRRAAALDLIGDALTKVVDDARAAGLSITAAGTLMTAQRGYPRDHPRSSSSG